MINVKLESINNLARLLEIMYWCETTFGPSKQDRLGRWIGGRWCLDRGLYWSFNFANSQDASLFALKWS